MTPAIRENLRILLLTALNAARGYAVGIEGLRLGLPKHLRRLDADDITAELSYLIDKGFVALEGKLVSPENREWKITANGRDFLATEGLA